MKALIAIPMVLMLLARPADMLQGLGMVVLASLVLYWLLGRR